MRYGFQKKTGALLFLGEENRCTTDIRRRKLVPTICRRRDLVPTVFRRRDLVLNVVRR